MDALKLANGSAKMVQDLNHQPAPKSTLTPQYKDANKKDLEKTFKVDPSMDFNTKLRKWFGLE